MAAAAGRLPNGDGIGRFQGFEPGRNVVRIREAEVPITPAAAASLEAQLKAFGRQPSDQTALSAKFVVKDGMIQDIGLYRVDP